MIYVNLFKLYESHVTKESIPGNSQNGYSGSKEQIFT